MLRTQVSKAPRHRPFQVLRTRLKAREERAPDVEKAAPRAELTFSEAATRTGVRALPERPRSIGRAQRNVSGPALEPARTPRFTVSTADERTQGYRTDAGPRALERLRRAPSATLDLHGARVERAREMLVAFLAAERARGRELVLVIVGKGRHSPGGRGVLRDEVADWLTGVPAARDVVAFESAPPRWGGSGGVLVLLAPPPRAGGARRSK
jgi:DNA-nicking Smr family endonuclease